MWDRILELPEQLTTIDAAGNAASTARTTASLSPTLKLSSPEAT